MAPSQPIAVILVALGGFFGSITRYGVALIAPGLGGTFVVNVTGSLLLGYIYYMTATTSKISARTRLLVATGFLSSYTTYSMFAFETLDASFAWGLLNVLGSYVCGFAAAVFGRSIALRGTR
jgi:CrcB protein